MVWGLSILLITANRACTQEHDNLKYLSSRRSLKIFFSREIKQSLRKKIDIPRKPYLTQTKYHGLFIVQETLYKPLSTFMYVYSECWARFDFYCRFVSFLFRYEKKIFVLLRLIFEKILLKTTSTISFSNQNDEPETCRFVFRFETSFYPAFSKN